VTRSPNIREFILVGYLRDSTEVQSPQLEDSGEAYDILQGLDDNVRTESLFQNQSFPATNGTVYRKERINWIQDGSNEDEIQGCNCCEAAVVTRVFSRLPRRLVHWYR
jgi:hypothetical protein